MSILIAALVLSANTALSEPAPAPLPMWLAGTSLSCDAADGADGTNCQIRPDRPSRDDSVPAGQRRKERKT
jgi:hypothetical protein